MWEAWRPRGGHRWLVCAAAWLAHGARAAVEQIHINMGRDATEMVVSWAKWDASASYVRVARSTDALAAAPRVYSAEHARYSIDDTCNGYMNVTYTSPFLHHATLTGLEPGSEYVYQVDDDGAPAYAFAAAPAAAPAYPLSVAVLGDMGQTKFSNMTCSEMVAHAPRPGLAMFVGDLSYADCDAPRWDRWARLTERCFAVLPTMVLPGNHEIELERRTGEAFRGYRARYRMPQAFAERTAPGTIDWSDYDANLTYDGGASYYGFASGPVHFVVLNTYADAARGALQRAWLEHELSCVYDRRKTPWLLAFMHAPWYNTNEKHQPGAELATARHKAALEGLLARAGVAAVFAGHVHAYERSTPVCFERVQPDGAAPTYVTVGDGGNRERLYDVWPYHRDAAWSAFRNGTRYGFGTLTVANATHARWEWLPNHRGGDPGDEKWIVNVRPERAAAACPDETGEEASAPPNCNAPFDPDSRSTFVGGDDGGGWALGGGEMPIAIGLIALLVCCFALRAGNDARPYVRKHVELGPRSSSSSDAEAEPASAGSAGPADSCGSVRSATDGADGSADRNELPENVAFV